MNIFDFTDYKKFVKARIERMPKRGYGQYRKIAVFLSVSSVNISQIFNGNRDLTVEQACELCDFLGLSKLESQYFVTLVEIERAGTSGLKAFLRERLDEIREKSAELKRKLPQHKQVAEEAKAEFYSNWFYSGIRLLSSVPGFQSPEAIAQHFGFPIGKVTRVLEFLVAHGLCNEKHGRFSIGSASTHLEPDSIFIARYKTDWRLKAIERLQNLSQEELCFSMPCSLSPKAFRAIRRELVDFIERIGRIVEGAPSEQLACLNIDWIRF